MKLCVNCIHHNGDTAKCMHDSAIASINPVDGEIFRLYSSSNRRLSRFTGHCGMKARFFVDKAFEK